MLKSLTILSFLFFLLHGVSSCHKEDSCEGCGDGNKSPIAKAGPDQTIFLPANSVSLDGRSSSDPDGSVNSFQWSKIAGPASSKLRTPNIAQTTADSLVLGIYLFELRVIDNDGLFGIDTVQITVSTGQPNQPPVAYAGPDQSIVLPGNYLSLNGSGSTDPDNNITSYLWKWIAGPPNFTISNVTAINTPVSFTAQGIYEFELTVTDAWGLFSKDTVRVNVMPQTSLTCVIPGSTEVGNFQGPVVDAVSVVCNDKFYIADGANLDVFDPASNTSSRESLSVVRSHVAITSAGDKVFVAGGYIYPPAGTPIGTSLTRVDIYNALTHAWSTSELSIPRYAIQACSIGNKAFFAGGAISPYDACRRIDIYDITTNSWTYKDFTTPGGFLPVVFSDKIWFIRTGTNQVEIYDATNNSWSTSSFTTVVNGTGTIVLNNKIYFTGSRIVQVYDIPANNWSTIVLNEEKFAIPAAASNNKIAFIGGMTSWFVYSSTIEIYDPATNSWSIQYMSTDLYYESLISYNNYIYSAGGMINQENASLSGMCRFQL